MENLRIVPVFGRGAVGVSPRVGHLHVHVDDLPWWWADPSNTNTVDITGMPPGQHKVRIELVDADHNTFPGQSETVKFTVPKAHADRVERPQIERAPENRRRSLSLPSA